MFKARGVLQAFGAVDFLACGFFVRTWLNMPVLYSVRGGEPIKRCGPRTRDFEQKWAGEAPPRFAPSASEQPTQDVGQGRFVAAEACDHRLQHCGWIEALKIKWVACRACHEGQKDALSASIALAERMNSVQFRQEVSCRGDKLLRGLSAQAILLLQLAEDPGHLPFDVLGVAEHAAALGDAYAPDLARPIVDILEEMTVN